MKIKGTVFENMIDKVVKARLQSFQQQDTRKAMLPQHQHHEQIRHPSGRNHSFSVLYGRQELIDQEDIFLVGIF